MNLHITTQGQGPNLILLHGWGFNSAVWQPIIPELETHFCLHLVDLPGHGHSPNLGIEHDVKALAQLIAKQTPANSILLGWSMGALITLALALLHPQHISKMILVAATPCFINNSDWQNGVENTIFQQFAKNLQKDYQATIKRFLTLQSLGNSNNRRRVKQLYTNLTQQPQPSSDALSSGLRLLEHTDLRSVCQDIQQPCLLIHSDDDKLVPLSAAQFLESTLGHAELTVLKKTGHIPFINQANKFTDLILKFAHGY